MSKVVYDFSFDNMTTYGCTKQFSSREEAIKWIADCKDDPYIYNLDIIEEVE